MREPTMTQGDLLRLIATVGTAVVLFSIFLFVMFRRFLEKERKRGEEFREQHQRDKLP